MDLTSIKTIKNLLRQHGLRPSRRLGQNFLIDRGAVRKIIDAADLGPEDTVLEIGPGLGVLTQELAKRAKKVIAVEKDHQMVKILGKTLEGIDNVRVIQGDIRKIQISNLKVQNYNSKLKIVGNLPFYLTAPVIRQFLESVEVKPQQMILVVQKEVGQRICSKPPDMNLLAVSVQFYAEPKIISYISKKSFWPSPEVDAAIIKITPLSKARSVLAPLFFKIVKAGFSQPRKQLINNLSRLRQGFGGQAKYDKKKVGEWLLKNNIKPSQRAETLSLEGWLKLTQ